MVTCKVDTQTVAIPKMNSVRTRKPSSSNSSALHLLDADHLEATSSVSRNSIYKLKIDLMFDDTRSIRTNRLDDPHGSRRTRSIIMYGRSELASTAGDSSRSIRSLIQEPNEAIKYITATANQNQNHTQNNNASCNGSNSNNNNNNNMSTQNNVHRISNSVQEQIEQLFTDVAKDATSTFAVVYLGSLPLKDKVTSLQGLQDPLRELYLNDIANEHQYSGFLDICATGLRVKINDTTLKDKAQIDENITPFHNIAVWSAVKFVVSEEDGGAAFLPLITDPDNIDKTALFQPLSPSEQNTIGKTSHAPIFAVVMRSSSIPKILECHGFLCRNTEDAVVIAATLYQSLMAHVNSNSRRSTKQRAPRNQNGVSCISIASSSAMTGSNYLSRSQIISTGCKSSFRSTTGSMAPTTNSITPSIGQSASTRSSRKKRVSNNSINSSNNVINEAAETTTEERKRKSHKTKRAPPIPNTKPGSLAHRNIYKELTANHAALRESPSIGCCVVGSGAGGGSGGGRNGSGGSTGSGGSRSNGNHKTSPNHRQRQTQMKKTLPDCNFEKLNMHEQRTVPTLPNAAVGSTANNSILRSIETNGDILTRVAIPRSGSFLNTGGLTRYKSRAARRHSGKLGGGGGGGSPLGFSELFNEFRLHENLHSLDDILNAIINADGMSFNDLKPIYKEFLLKLAVTLTKDELFQRSKHIMRRQKKKKLKRKSSATGSQKKSRGFRFGATKLKKVFQFGQFRACRRKSTKNQQKKRHEEQKQRHSKSLTPKGSLHEAAAYQQQQQQQLPPHHHQHLHHGQQGQQRNRAATSGSDVSVIRNENVLGQGFNRNSSSGYVSCSECSYDSEACTCISADRCYCSLKNTNKNKKILRKQERNNPNIAKKSLAKSNSTHLNRHSLISCQSDEKCYCSMAENDMEQQHGHDDGDTTSHGNTDTTTSCDTDSCVSVSKCYCQRTGHRRNKETTLMTLNENHSNSPRRHHKQNPRKSSSANKLALDYELFNINGNTQSVQPHEALSVKKSVEAAAIFADVKLSQTTDIKSMCPSPFINIKQLPSHIHNSINNNSNNNKGNGSCRSYAPVKKQSIRKRDSTSTDRHLERPTLISLSSNSSQRSCSADDLLNKLNAMENIIGYTASIKNGYTFKQYTTKDPFQNNYQTMKAVNASLEDTLGYLP